MPTTNQDASAQRAKQTRSSDVQSYERARDGTPKAKDEQLDNAEQDQERSDWEGMTARPEQGEDDIAAPGQLPETD